MNIRKIKYFLLVGMWKEENDDRKGIIGRSINWLRKLWLAVIFFIRRGHSDYATALSFSTLLAIVPVFAVVFAIARGFDLSIYIEVWFRNLLSSQPQVAESIIELANSYLAHAKSGVIMLPRAVFTTYVSRIMSAILTKLLAMSIVANRRSGFSRSSSTRCSRLPSEARKSSRSVGVRAKKATSEADTKPDTASNKTLKTNDIMT
jgi:hypothetical protein